MEKGKEGRQLSDTTISSFHRPFVFWLTS